MKASWLMLRRVSVVGLWVGLALQGTAHSQSPAVMASSVGPEKAAPAIQQTTAAMGGEAWNGLGAATTQVTITYPKGDIKPRVTKRSDDWSRDGATQRDEPTDAHSGGAASGPVLFTSGGARIRKSASGKLSIEPRGYDLSSLALAYPAVALRLASQRKECTTTAAPAAKAGFAVIRQVCVVRGIPGPLRYTWLIDSAGLPKELEFPVLSHDGRVIPLQTAVFRSFQKVQGLTVSSIVDVRLGGSLLYTVSFAVPTFSSSLPASLFSSR